MHGPFPGRAQAHSGAYSEDKGCYPGQEVVARTLHRGHVNWKLRGLRWIGGEPLDPGLEVFVGGKEVARITSVAGDLGLGYVRREHYDAGTELKLENGARILGEDRPFARL
ncbi:MAG: hypothetical protein HY319_30555 [Armatimonadetes bacterium]|nr:hypothetical protein [Armatimonadota bacterium]